MPANRKALIIAAALVAIALSLSFGSAVPTASAQIQVLSATPTSADQGTFSLPVTIKGNGFKKGAKAKFLVSGTTDTGGITVTSTKFIDSTQLVATIDVASTAAVAQFDILVANTDGRTGKGTEPLFSVTKKVDPCLVPDPVPTRTTFTSDGSGYPGFLDGRFGAGTGQVVSPPAFRGGPVAIQVVEGESRLVRAGRLDNSYCTNDGQNTTTWAVVRYRPSGVLDESFGNGGVVTTLFTGGSADANALAIDGLNRIVVVGAAPPKRGASKVPTVARYNEDGSLDTGFANGGVAAIPFGRDGGYATAVVLQSNGKIVIVAEVSSAPNLAVIRLDAQGALDSTFNGTGKFVDTHVAVSIGGFVTTQWIGDEERIVVSGRLSRTAFNCHWLGALWRLTAAGALDAGFGSGGVVLTDYNPTSQYEDLAGHGDVAVDGTNRLVVAVGLSAWQADLGRYLSKAAVARFLDTGAPDTSFAGTGMVVLPGSATPSEGSSSCGGVAIQGDGRIFVVGADRVGPDGDPSDLAAWRVEDDGSLDLTFGNGGWISHPVTTEPRSASGFGGGTRIVEGPDGTFLIAGVVHFSFPNGWVPYGFLARFWQ